MPEEEQAELLVFIVESEYPGGVILDEARAKASACKCLETSPPKLCFVPGIIGTLTVAQTAQYCTGKENTKLSDGRRQRINKFVEAARICTEETRELPKGERLKPRLECMSRELKARGVEV